MCVCIIIWKLCDFLQRKSLLRFLALKYGFVTTEQIFLYLQSFPSPPFHNMCILNGILYDSEWYTPLAESLIEPEELSEYTKYVFQK